MASSIFRRPLNSPSAKFFDSICPGLAVASWAFKRVTRELLLRMVALLLLANGISLIARGAG